MIKSTLVGITLCLSFVAGRATAQIPSFLCTPEQTVGFLYQLHSEHWAPQIILQDHQYVVRPFDFRGKDNGLRALVEAAPFRPTFGVFDKAEDDLLSLCRMTHSNGTPECTPYVDYVIFNTKMDQFQIYSPGEYLTSGSHFSPDPPTLAIGRCEPYYDETPRAEKPPA
jgi:hypothetical protein